MFSHSSLTFSCSTNIFTTCFFAENDLKVGSQKEETQSLLSVMGLGTGLHASYVIHSLVLALILSRDDSHFLDGKIIVREAKYYAEVVLH